MVAIEAANTTVATDESEDRFDWSLVGCLLGALILIAISALSIAERFVQLGWTEQTRDLVAYSAFALAVTAPVMLCWMRSIRDGKLPRTNGADPKYDHISGWGAIFLFAVVSGIAWLVLWAASSEAADRKIHSLWGTGIVIALSIAFVAVATAPMIPRLIRLFGAEDPARKAAELIGRPIDAIGRQLSMADSFLVFAVANAAATNRRNFFLRYAVLISIVAACAVLGYQWSAPWGLVPITWGFIVAFAVSRRWAWIEDDRELAMLNPTLPTAYIRVGFGQNLRDEALVSFMSMFLLVPLALRQLQMLAVANGADLFSFTDGATVDSLDAWVGFYGTELAKAVPFVDWAEVYHVDGEAPIQVASPLGQHAVFATRVLIDLVFLAALLQAIANASRDAQQRDLFYTKTAITRLDPFTEPDALRALVTRDSKGEWVANGERFETFPRYDSNRLIELTTSSDERVRSAARLLLTRDKVENDPNWKLSSLAAQKDATVEAIGDAIAIVEQLQGSRNLFQLDLTRKRLVRKPPMVTARRRLIVLMVNALHSKERTQVLLDSLVGEEREPTYHNRWLALEGLMNQLKFDERVRMAFEQVKNHDAAQDLRHAAQVALSQAPETPD